MKKKAMWISIFSVLAVAIIITAIVLFLPCNHQWTNATCTLPKTCSKCQETEGEPLGHSWNAATCENPNTCSICQAIDGEPLGHSWDEATCETPKTCKTCGEEEGESVGHKWKNATCQNPKTCSVCKKIEGGVGKHNYTAPYDDGIVPPNTRCCCYCGKIKPNVVCPKCNWSTYTTGVGIDGITCPKCGYKVL